MTDETKRKRDELAEVYSGLFPTKSEWIEGKKDRHNYLSYEVKDEVEQAFSDGFDAGYAEGQAEIERLNKILRQEFNENDELGAEYLGITMVRSENKELRAKISIHEAKSSQFESTLTETMRVRDEYKARLDKAVAALRFYADGFAIMDHIDGTYEIKTEWYRRAREALAEIEGEK
jgi:hypothetical protein